MNTMLASEVATATNQRGDDDDTATNAEHAAEESCATADEDAGHREDNRVQLQ
jgi:hypothetical protein